ncbi:hypothetical protein KFU94_26495 [Chloroflexi bacterium TSY]|nr:hypothetical protein [Chloroflexi bacterium TSY]
MKWLDYLEEFDIPYGGTSAGAAIAARHAILGGWQRECDGTVRSILFPGASEGLDFLTIRPGLALVPFAVDVHASQMGTLTRLIHAVDSRQVAEGWAIDENTLLQVSDEGIQVYGQGHAYRVQRNNQRAIAIETVHCQSE